jgi:uncharacterized membrane protein (DUF4010 family)
MLLRNGVILGILAPLALLAAAIPLGLMFLGAAAAARLGRPNADAGDSDARLTTLQSPFSLTAALRFGFVFLALQVAGNLAQRTLGNTGFYGVSAIGGVISSASAVASAANLAASGTLTPQAAALGAVLASVTSALVSLPLVRRVTGERSLTNQVAMAVTATALLGVIGIFIQKLIY